MKAQLSLLLALFAMAGTAANAQEPATPMADQVRAQLPAYDPAVRAAEERRLEEARKAGFDEEEVVTLPELTVQEKSVRRMEEDTLYRRGAWDKELVKRELSEFDRFFLNRFTIPLFGISKEARARSAYLERKNREFNTRINEYADALESTAPSDAKALRVVMQDNARSGETLASVARPQNWR